VNEPSVSVIVNTYNRAASLRVLLQSLQQLDYTNFEVVIVNGPSTDETPTVLADYAGVVKQADCPRPNLAESRNIGLAHAAGELVAFIDDDAYPDPAWLTRIVEAYDSDEVAAAGGPVYDHTGNRLQARYSVANRFGIARVDDGPLNPSIFYSNPSSPEFAYCIGTNSSFRRSALIQIGGFDEEFEYYLEETDACLRLLERGLLVRLIDHGFVYHKFLPSEIRDTNRALKDRYSVFKNTCYFALKHGLAYASFADVCSQLTGFIQGQRADLAANVAHGTLGAADAERFERDLPRAFDAGLRAHLRGSPLYRDPHFFAAPAPFLPYAMLRPATVRLHLCLLIQEWPPAPLNGIARVVHTLAEGLAGAGHVVHVLTRGDDHDRVDLEHGVWVHRVCVRPHPAPTRIEVPARIWDYSASLLDELVRIDSERPIDVVQFPNWDSEGIAALLNGRFHTVLGLYTPLRSTRAVDPVLGAPSRELDQLEQLERFCYLHADRLLACGPAIVSEIEQRYGIVLDPERIGYVAHGVEEAPSNVRSETHRDQVKILFVGRLEPRKGIDTLLDCAPRLAARFPEVRFTIVGKDAHPWPDGRTMRARFEAAHVGSATADRIHFEGLLDEDALLREYAGCDILVAPSRFESFGLMLLEAMRVSKPVVACRVGGMTDIVEDGGNGFLVPPGDSMALEAALSRLIESGDLRSAFGLRSRQLFEENYSVDRMVTGVNREYDRVSGASTLADASAPIPHPAADATVATVPGARVDGAGRGASGEAPGSRRPHEGEPFVGGDSSAAVETEGEAVGAADARIRIMNRLRCPSCRGTALVRPSVVTADGHVRSGQVVCDGCGVVGVIQQGKFDFRAEAQELAAIGAPRIVPVPGELRLTAKSPGIELRGRWASDPSGWVHSEGSPADSLQFEGSFTDAVVRLLHHPSSGIADLYLDDALVKSVDLFQGDGSTMAGIPIAQDLEFGPHKITVRPRGSGHPDSAGVQVYFEELVLWGPRGAAPGFAEPEPINRGNPYSDVIERCISECPPTGMILEIGGGDRRRVDPRHLNAEYLKFELADIYSDIHSLPFADDTFDLVFSQAVFEHVAQPFEAARELIRVTRPGGVILTEVAFMQPLHAVPYHYFNMTPWGVEELFGSCEVLEIDWFGELSFTVDWLLRSVNLHEKLPPDRLRHLTDEFRALDHLVSHQELRTAASGVHLVVRKPT
jgi:glycosyltransferase involved in cell wall biosynthesis/SAM-dependent methyltransferase